jgi:cell cycle checkpoint protein
LRGLFDEYEYNYPAEDDEIAVPSTTFEIALDTLVECLNIFGSGGGVIIPAPSEKNGKRGWHNKGDDNDDRPNRTGALKTSWNKGAEKVTMMKMTYQDTGYPLTLILWAPIYATVHRIDHNLTCLSAEDSSGPTTTVEITTLESAENLDLPFDDDDACVDPAFQSSVL